MDAFDYAILALVLILTVGYFFYNPSRTILSKKPTAVGSRIPSGGHSAPTQSISTGFLSQLIQKKAKLIVFYGSQTGTAEDYARRLVKEGAQYGMRAILADLMDYQMEDLSELSSDYLAVFVLATYGDGEPTDNAHDFFEWLSSDHADDTLKSLRYVIFGLGNKTYTHFNAMARKCDASLQRMGAKKIHDRGEGDDDGNLEEDFVQWKDEMWKSVCRFFSINPASVHSDLLRSYAFTLLPPTTRNIYHGEHGVINSWSGNQKRVTYDQANPYYAKIKSWNNLYLVENNDQEIRRKCFHIDIDISGTSLRYQAGDHVALYAPNDPDEVFRLARILRIDDKLDDVFEMRSSDVGGPASKKTPFPCPTTLRAALTFYLDITSLPRMHVMSLLAKFANDETEKAHLKQLSSMDSKLDYHHYIVEKYRNLAQILEEHPSVKFEYMSTKDGIDEQKSQILTLGDLFEILPKLQPRYYSISSSPKVNNDSISVTATLVEYKTPLGRKGRGVATGYFDRLLNSEAWKVERIPIFLRKSHFKLPKNNLTPIIMIGPGTGIAPLRSFYLDRKVVLENKLNDWYAKKIFRSMDGAWPKYLVNSSSSAGKLVVRRVSGNLLESDPPVHKMIGETLLFFGCRNRNQDFLYCEELLDVKQDVLGLEMSLSKLHDGLTGLYCAFSRESATKKTYVQDLIYENGADVWDALSKNAYVYVCGDAKNMAKDVLQTMLKLAREHGKMMPSEAELWVKKLQDSGRYQEDVWS